MSQPIEGKTEQKKVMIYLLPLGISLLLVLLFYFGLGLNSRLIPSALIGQPIPAFTLPKLSNQNESISNTDLKGTVSLLNIWATWCPSCKQEHPVLLKISKTNRIPIYGLFYKDDPTSGIKWLKHYGDPYVENAIDLDGTVGIDWGTYGTPETFLIDKNGTIQYKHVGPISWDDWQNKILPIVHLLETTDA